jgi:DNA helicase II / ATP-dependent DNA helicase PcrA
MAWNEGLDAAGPAYRIASSVNERIRVVAGPGAGKSFAMKRRVARLLEEGIEAGQILPVTFTRVAAEDLHRELVGMGVEGCEDIEGVTLHSLAMRILMRQHVLEATGRTPRPLNEFEIKSLLADMSGFGGVREVRKLIRSYESAWARLQQDEPGFVQTDEEARFERELLVWLRFHRATLIGEVIPILHNYLRSNPTAVERSEFMHILVDEYQDLNRAEQSVIELLGDAADVCIVGDDDQSIYGFKHAHPDGIREWLDLHNGADDLTLAECRRCPTRVVTMANHLIARNVNRPVPRALVARAENGEGDVRIIQYASLDREVVGISALVRQLIAQGHGPGDILILAQRGVIGTPIYEALRTQDVPARSYYAESELDADTTQVRFAFLKLFGDRSDRVALRWLLGCDSSSWRAGSYRRLREHCEDLGTEPWDALEALAVGTIVISHTNPLVARFQVIREEMRILEALPDLRSVVDRLLPDGDVSVRDVRALALGILEGIDDDDRETFLSELVGAIAKPEVPSEIHDVRVMSLHKSKGLSAPGTIIAGCIEGLLPRQPDPGLPPARRDAELEEQRRLFYVGITRVKADPAAGKPGVLILSYSANMPVADAMGAGIRPASTARGTARLHASRFIHELGPAAPRPITG